MKDVFPCFCLVSGARVLAHSPWDTENKRKLALSGWGVHFDSASWARDASEVGSLESGGQKAEDAFG